MPKRIIHKRALAFVLLLFFMASLILPVSLITPAQAAGFFDISGHWARNDILQLASLSIVKGNRGKFNPGGAITRAEFATMIISALGYADQAKLVQGVATSYKDVSRLHWASGYIILAREKGIITGYPDGTFKPGNIIRRDEFVNIIVRALNIPDGSDKSLGIFTDAGDIPDWARISISSAYEAGLVSGFPDRSFKPGQFVSRGEAAALIKKVLAEFGRQYTMYASIEDISPNGRSLILNVAGQVTTVEMTDDTTVLFGDKITGIGALQAGDYVYVNLNDDGKVTYIEQTDATYAEIGGFTGKEGAVSATSLQARRGVASDAIGIRSEPEIRLAAMRTVLVSTVNGKAEEVAGLIKGYGGIIKVFAPDLDFLTAEISEKTYDEIARHPLVLQINDNRQVKVTRPETLDEVENIRPQSIDNLDTEGNPAESLETTREAVGINDFILETGADGTGQVIAIIDTGIDPGHPDLQKTSSGKPKISAWLDFTGEGDIDTNAEVLPDKGILHLVNGDYSIGSIRSKSGRFHYGYLQGKTFYGAAGDVIDMNFNGSASDIFTVIVVDSTVSGQYDRVYVDTDGDKDFSDEKGLTSYDINPNYIGFKSIDNKNIINLALTRIEKNGREINFGFDGNDHGTHVAGIATANGAIQGMAPGAQVMSLKVLKTDSFSSPAVISEAIIWAAKHGAKVINLSLGFREDDDDSAVLNKLIADLSVKYGVLFVTAAGNGGPGLQTAAGIGATGSVLSVGAFSSSEMWRKDYGWDVPDSNLWYLSSIGPNSDGSPTVSVVAPGSVVSTVPLRDGACYYSFEGTSMAAPHVAGAAVLLLDAATRENLKVSPRQIKKALEKGAHLIQGYSPVEQGFGVINTAAAWQILHLSPPDIANVNVRNYNIADSNGAGVFAREYLPGRLTFYLSDMAGKARSLELGATDYWIKPEQKVINIPASGGRGLDLDIRLPEEPGLYSAFLTGTNMDSSFQELNALATVVKPHILEPDNNYMVSIEGTMTPAKYKRYFFRVLPGSNKLQVKLSVPDGKGRVKMFLYGPGGKKEVAKTDFAGVNPDGTVESVEVSADFPTAGTWELVIYSSAALSAYGMKQSTYEVNFTLEEVKPVQLPPKNRDIVVSVLPKTLTIGKKTYLTVQVLDRYTLHSFEGLLDINGMTYFTRQGRVLLPVDPQDTTYTLVVKTISPSTLTVPLEFRFKMPVKDR